MISLEMISCPGITKKRRSEERKEKEKKSIEVGPNRNEERENRDYYTEKYSV